MILWKPCQTLVFLFSFLGNLLGPMLLIYLAIYFYFFVLNPFPFTLFLTSLGSDFLGEIWQDWHCAKVRRHRGPPCSVGSGPRTAHKYLYLVYCSQMLWVSPRQLVCTACIPLATTDWDRNDTLPKLCQSDFLFQEFGIELEGQPVIYLHSFWSCNMVPQELRILEDPVVRNRTVKQMCRVNQRWGIELKWWWLFNSTFHFFPEKGCILSLRFCKTA